MSCGQAHSSAWELVARGNEPKLVAETLAFSRSSLYYQRQSRRSRADRSRDPEIILACGEKPANGEVFGLCQKRHRHQEWLQFSPHRPDHSAPRAMHLICDNYATQKHPKVHRWLARHPRFHLHFTSTSASWLNMVERFFRDLTQNRLRRGVFRDLEELIMAIGTYIDRNNESPKPFIWTALRR